MEEQTPGIALLQELGCGSSHQWGCGENPLQFVLPFSSFSCPGSWPCCHGRLGDGLPAPIEMQSIGNARGETLAWSGKWETAAGSRVTPCSGTSQDWASTWGGAWQGSTMESQLCSILNSGLLPHQPLLLILSRHKLSLSASQGKG